ncbi:GNAT family N-acetyltransferase [Deinococcus maricopensis]|uniref:GCN5-related N-acetyltransferase n=1 Tax=Deinococcus maricopensis (strain DSM 21211 / LMG 22137 / NRRL B-23946 / LB-34) TaxID=709986 RepID=E8U6T6_DEIML|nr:GNAT family N-acetyltransferase [Deinococcus maricopensis]ADV66775.1 GCN5-related N-acetyltransferase [Deinococcus maricopensis DSM 21211]
MTLTVRPARPEDAPFLAGLAPRFTAFGLPAWRDEAAVRASMERALALAVTPPADGACLIVQDERGEPLGFVTLATDAELFTDEPEAYLANLAVTAGAEGRGAADALLDAAEAWARARGLPRLTLNVFAGNARARALYARRGFHEDSLKLVRVLTGDL